MLQQLLTAQEKKPAGNCSCAQAWVSNADSSGADLHRLARPYRFRSLLLCNTRAVFRLQGAATGAPLDSHLRISAFAVARRDRPACVQRHRPRARSPVGLAPRPRQPVWPASAARKQGLPSRVETRSRACVSAPESTSAAPHRCPESQRQAAPAKSPRHSRCCRPP